MGMSTPASVPTTPDHAPVAMTTAGASNAPAAVVTPLTRSPSRRNPRTSCCCLITTPRSRARGDRGRAEVRVGVPVARRIGRAEQIVGVEVRAERARRRRVEQLDIDAEASLERDAAPRRGQLVVRRDQDEVSVLTEMRIDAELFLEPLVGDDAVGRQLDAEAVRI